MGTYTDRSHPEAVVRLEPDALKALLRQNEELAILDVREEGVFARKHLLFAVNAPLWRLELVVAKLVPSRSTRIVLVDLDGSLLDQAVELLHVLGYRHVALLSGGTLAWEQAGHGVFSGVNLLSKAFGEVIEAQCGTPHISVQALQEKLAQGENVVVLDGRTQEEFQRFSVPGAHSLPNGELLYRVYERAPDPETLVVINCAGRTRSIVGAQTLINAGIPNRVVALKDGTMAWLQAGNELRRGAVAELPEPSEATLALARAHAQELAQKSGLSYLDDAALAAFEAQSAQRSLFKFDVRTRIEYESGHSAGWRWAPGGQLVQATDRYVGVLGARIVLADFDGVRAVTTASWLAQLGTFEVYLHRPSLALLETGPEPGVVTPANPLSAEPVSAARLASLVAANQALVYDVEDSQAFAAGHIAGAFFSAPDRLAEFLQDGAAAGRQVVITSGDGVLARLVASRLRERHGVHASYLAGGTRAWRAQERALVSGREHILTGDDDKWYSPYFYPTPQEQLQQMEAYLAWEVALAEQLEKEGDSRIRLIKA